MSFNINNKLTFIDSFQFLSYSLDSLVKNLSKNDFKYLSEEFDNNVLDLAKQKAFYPYEYMSNFEKFKEQLSNKEKFYILVLQLVLDTEMYLFFEKAMIGGVSYISKRYSKANNKHLKCYDPK